MTPKMAYSAKIVPEIAIFTEMQQTAVATRLVQTGK